MAIVHMLNKVFYDVATFAFDIKLIICRALATKCAIKACHAPGPRNRVVKHLLRLAVHMVSHVVMAVLHPCYISYQRMIG